MAEKIFFSPDEVKLENALQLLAILICRLGGEVSISRKEFSEFEGCPIVGKDYGECVVLRLGDEDEEEEMIEGPLEG